VASLGRPKPGAGFLATVQAHLDRHRLLTTSVHVVAPVFIRFSLAVRIVLARRSAEAEVRKRLAQDLVHFFDPLDGGPSPGGSGCRRPGGWPFGRSIYPSEIYERIDRDPGVDYASRVRLRRVDADGSVHTLDVDQLLSLPQRGLPDFSLAEFDLELVPFGEEVPEGDGPCAVPCVEQGDA
jgi:hypothetical protein